MPDIKRIVAEMPKAKFVGTKASENSYESVFKSGQRSGRDAQCRLLAEQGWRKVRSVEEILERLVSITGWTSTLNRECLRQDAEKLHCELLEGEE